MSQQWIIVNWAFGNMFQLNSNQSTSIFIDENPFENVVWIMSAVLCRPQCVNNLIRYVYWVTIRAKWRRFLHFRQDVIVYYQQKQIYWKDSLWLRHFSFSLKRVFFPGAIWVLSTGREFNVIVFDLDTTLSAGAIEFNFPVVVEPLCFNYYWPPIYCRKRTEVWT